jgi:hypothetical protein
MQLRPGCSFAHRKTEKYFFGAMSRVGNEELARSNKCNEESGEFTRCLKNYVQIFLEDLPVTVVNVQ